jgi:WD40 repeat protein
VDGTIIVWDAKLGTPRRGLELKSHYVPLAASFLSQRLLAVGHKDGSIAVWDLDRGKRLWDPKSILNEPIVAVQGVKNSDELYIAAKSGQIAVVDFRTGFSRIEIIPRNSNRRFGAISPDGRLAVSYDSAERLVLLGLDTRRWAELACSRVGRSLGREEWASFIGPEIPYNPACIDGRYEGSQVGE